MTNWTFVANDKGSVRRARPAGPALSIGALISRRAVLGSLGGLSAGALLPSPLAAALRLPAAPVRPHWAFDELAFGIAPNDRLAEGYRRQVLISWGDPLFAGDAPFDHRQQTPESAARRFGTNNDFTQFVPLDGDGQRGLLVVSHEYPTPELMFDGLERGDTGNAQSHEQIAIVMQSLGLSVIEVRRGPEEWQVVQGSPFTRRITATTPIAISGPVAGHPLLRTAADPSGTLVLGTHDNCNGGLTPWDTILSCEEGSADFFGGQIEGLPGEAMLRRNHYETGASRYGWERADERFDISRHPNEVNRFEWVVELDPLDPTALPVKRTALGRFAHEGAQCAAAPDGRLVVYLGDDWDGEYIYRFVSRDRVDPISRGANRDLLDHGTLAVGRFHEDGTLEWRGLVHGEGPLVAANGFHSQADVLLETRRAADLLGATPMDSPEGYAANPTPGLVYLALTGNRERTRADAANPRGPNPEGHMLELVPPPGADGIPDHAADVFGWNVFLLAGDPADKAAGAGYHPDTSASGWFSQPDNIGFNPAGRLWLCSDGPGARGHDGLWVIDTAGANRARPRHFYSPPAGAECCSPSFTPDGDALFLSIQHPGDGSASIAAASTRWPNSGLDGPPRPSVVVISAIP